MQDTHPVVFLAFNLLSHVSHQVHNQFWNDADEVASVAFGPPCEGGGRGPGGYPNDFHRMSVCISLATALAIHHCLQGNLCLGALGWLQFWTNQDLISKQQAESGYWEYATNCTHHIPRPNSLSFHVDLFVYLIMLRTGLFLLSFHDLSPMRFLCVISSNSSIGMGCLLHVARVKCLVPIFDFRGPWGMDRIREFVSLRVPESLK